MLDNLSIYEWKVRRLSTMDVPGECPRLQFLSAGYGVNTDTVAIGTEVTVSCHGRHLVSIKCQENRAWNATVPSCDLMATSLEPPTGLPTGSQDFGVSVVGIIVWVLGGLLLISLIILILVIINTRRKPSNSTRGNNDGGTSVFTITGRQSRGGDNPAFCRTDESSSGERSCHRSAAASQGPDARPPSYQEAVSGRMITVHAPRTPSERMNNNGNTNRSQQPREASSVDPEAVRGPSASSRRARYADDYPSCFWEEEPPPPYSLCNFGVVRVIGEQRIDSQGRERGGSRAEVPRVNSPNPVRAPLAVPTPTVLSPVPSPVVQPRGQLQGTLSSGGATSAVPQCSFLQEAGLHGLHRNPQPMATSSPTLTRPIGNLSYPALPLQRPDGGYLADTGTNVQASPSRTRTRAGSCRGQQGCHVDSRLAQPRQHTNAPLARHDFEYY